MGCSPELRKVDVPFARYSCQLFQRLSTHSPNALHRRLKFLDTWSHIEHLISDWCIGKLCTSGRDVYSVAAAMAATALYVRDVYVYHKWASHWLYKPNIYNRVCNYNVAKTPQPQCIIDSRSHLLKYEHELLNQWISYRTKPIILILNYSWHRFKRIWIYLILNSKTLCAENCHA